VEGAEGSQALEGANVFELSKSRVHLKLDGMECESEIPNLAWKLIAVHQWEDMSLKLWMVLS
jgi:hypothetical protein